MDDAEIGPDDLIAGCFTPDILADSLGVAGAFGAVFMLSGALVDFFRSRANAMGDMFNQRDEYRLVVALAEPGQSSETDSASGTNDPDEAIQLWATALIDGRRADAERLERPGREPYLYDWAVWLQGGDMAWVWPDARCFGDGARWRSCSWLQADPAPSIIVENIDGRWYLSHAVSLGMRETSLGEACVAGSESVGIRGGVGESWPDFATIPTGDCSVRAFDEVREDAGGQPWRAVTWNELDGWVPDEAITLNSSGPFEGAPPCTADNEGDMLLDPIDPAMTPPWFCEDGEWVPSF